MKWFLNQRLTVKLLLSSCVLLSLAGILGAFAILQLASVNDVAAENASRHIPRMSAIADMKTLVSEFRLAGVQHVLAAGPTEKEVVEKKLADVAKAFESRSKDFVQLIDRPAERQRWESFQQKWTAYLVEHQKVLELSNSYFTEGAKEASAKNAQPRFEEARADLAQLNESSSERARDSGSRSVSTYETARIGIIAALACAVAIGVGLAMFVARMVSRPLNQALKIAQTVAAGDLGSKIEAASRDETGELLVALGEMNNCLGSVVGSVRDCAANVASCSVEIAQSSADLNGRSETQASKLREAAASMDQVTGAARTTAETARQATALANSTSVTAEAGGDMVKRVVSTMEEISASSRQIGDIIGVIDGIAFQTNILALNAAVEAARAGDEGRGFAVVAAEVRNLAQRSAVAAKEIKSLIGASIEKVNAGSGLVVTAGSTMGDIVSQVRQLNVLLSDMAKATTEQDAAIGLVNVTVGELDQATRQSLSLVQSSASAAAALQTQSAQLMDAVKVFKLASA